MNLQMFALLNTKTKYLLAKLLALRHDLFLHTALYLHYMHIDVNIEL